MHSVLEILAVIHKEGITKKGPNAGKPYRIPEAHCALRNDKGDVVGVGVLNIPKPLEEVAKVGLFTGAFALEAPTYGENAGKIVATLTGLTPIPRSQLSPTLKAAA